MDNQNDKMKFIAEAIRKAKRVIDKVETDNFSRGNIAEQAYVEPVMHNSDMPAVHDQQPYQEPSSVLRNISSSKMPSAILDSFQKNPPSGEGMAGINTNDPLAVNNYQMTELSNMITEAGSKGRALPPNNQAKQQPQQPQQRQQTQQYSQQSNLSEDYIKYLIDMAIKETIVKTVATVLSELNKPSTLDENIQIKIGSKTFGGKIKTLKG